MSKTLDDLRVEVQATPLSERIVTARRMIGNMCKEGRCPKMSVPVQATDEDFFISTTLADASALVQEARKLYNLGWLAAMNEAIRLVEKRRETLGDVDLSWADHFSELAREFVAASFFMVGETNE